MAQAIMDPEKVRRFADELQRFNSDLENRMMMLHARFAALGDTWSDQEHEKFSEEFKQAMKALKKFVELSKEHTPYLLRKAQRIEEKAQITSVEAIESFRANLIIFLGQARPALEEVGSEMARMKQWLESDR